jgi:hypothetical protein
MVSLKFGGGRGKAAPPKLQIKRVAESALTDTPSKVATRNFFGPLRTTTMDTDSSGSESTPQDETVPAKNCRPPPIILTSAANLIQLQKQLKNVVKEDECRNTRSRTRVITRGMADFLAVKSHFEGKNLSFTFYPKPKKPIKVVIRHLPINVKQMTTRRSPPGEPKLSNLPLFLVTLPRTAKSQNFSNCQASATLPSRWRHINRRTPSRSATTVSSSATSGQTANSLSVVYGAWATTCTKSAPKKENAASTPACCNCQLRKGIAHNHVDLPPLVSVEATGICIPIGKYEILLAAIYKSPSLTWSDADIIGLLSFRHKSILAGDLNAKSPFWNSRVSNFRQECERIRNLSATMLHSLLPCGK